MGTKNANELPLQIVGELIGTGGLREFDKALARELARGLRCDLTGLYLYNQSARAFTPVSECLIDPASPGYQIGQLPAAGTMKEAAVQAGRALLCNDLGASPWTEAHIVSKAVHAFSSVIVAPLIRRSDNGAGQTARTIAVLAAVAVGNREAFTEDDRRFMEELAVQIAPVLQTVLASEERDALMAINSRVLVGAVTMEELVPAIMETIRQVIPHDMNGLVRFTTDAQGPWFEPIHIDGFELNLEPLRQYPFERMAPAEMLATGKPVLITGYGHERFPERTHIESLGILSAMLCPLTVRGKPYGFLAIGARRRNAFSERDVALAEQIGHHLSQAVANILAYDEIRRLKDQIELENVYLRDEIRASVDFKELVGESPALQTTLKTIEKVAPTDSTVLLTGETGTGKELVAQAIHQLSPRKARPLITVNCAALPPTLIESELFGHEKGAFTSAVARKIGRFELADRGTIFLDEIGEIPLEVQVKLLRVLEAQEVERVGGNQTIKLNVRVIAATNADLDQAVQDGTFRSDLYYRLKVFPIRIPPLRERGEDIPMLARHFVKKYSARHRKTVTRIDSATLRALTAYAWPGNVRELEHMIERAIILSQGPILTIEELDSDQPTAGTARSGKSAKGVRTLAEAERAHILDVLDQTNWVVAGAHGAAARLDMKRSTLQHRMKKLEIKKPSRSRS
ncbi:MAG: GAF domain-containing protein [Nitrospirae bacterium]|nr:MAG: GAF domain-containing protein [Nitrospirota bacterium]